MPQSPTPPEIKYIFKGHKVKPFFTFPIHSASKEVRNPRNSFRLSATKSHACHAKCIFTGHKTSHLLIFAIDCASDDVRESRNKFCLRATNPRLPREMHFHASQNITFSHFPHRQREKFMRARRNNNDLQTLRSSQAFQKKMSGMLKIKKTPRNARKRYRRTNIHGCANPKLKKIDRTWNFQSPLEKLKISIDFSSGTKS